MGKGQTDKEIMKLTVKHTLFTNVSTISTVDIDGQFECYVLEHPQRAVKIDGITGIPSGTYVVTMTVSPHFSKPHGPRICPLVNNVPGFEGVRIHHGNKPSDSDGCLLVGREKALDSVLESRKALAQLLWKMWRRRKEGIRLQILP